VSCGCQQMGRPSLGALRTEFIQERNLGGLPTVFVRERNLGALQTHDLDTVQQTIAQLEADEGSLENDLAVLTATGGPVDRFNPMVNEISSALVDLEDQARALGDAAMASWLARADLLRKAIASVRAQIATVQPSGGRTRAVLIGASAVLVAAIFVGTLAMKGGAH
jgi:hypothetical protein